MGTNPEGDPKKFIQLIMNGKKFISQSKEFKSISIKINPREDVLVYCNIDRVVKKNYKSIIKIFKDIPFYSSGSITNAFKMLKDYKGGAIAVDLDNKDLVVKAVYEIKPGAKSLKLFENYKFNKKNILGINKNPLFLFLVGMNFQQYYNYLLKIWPKNFTKMLADGFKEIKKKYNINVEREIIKNFAGSLNIAVFDGSTINMMNYNTLFTINIKNERVMRNVLKKVFAKAPAGKFSREKIGNVNAYVINAGFVQVFAGIKDRVFIVASSRAIFEESLKGSLSRGFLPGMKDESLKKTLKGKVSLFYLKADEILKAVGNLGTFAKNIKPETKKIVKRFDYLLVSSWKEKNFFYGNIIVKTRFVSPFFIELMRIVKKL